MKESPVGAIWKYRTHTLKKVEWGLWKVLDEPDYYFICYRPFGSVGKVTRRFVRINEQMSLAKLKTYVRNERALIETRRLRLPTKIDCQDAKLDYLADMKRRRLSDKHMYDSELAIDRLLTYSEVVTLDELTQAGIEEFLIALTEDGATPRTHNKYRQAIVAWINWCHQRGRLETNPAARITKAKQIKTAKPFPLLSDFLEILKASSRYDASLWTFLACTGVRVSSFLALTPKDFQAEGIHFAHTKRNEEWFLRYDSGCPLWKPDLGELGKLIWKQMPPREAYIRYNFAAATKNVFTPHSLRHAFCSWLAQAGEPLIDIAAWAHHASVVTTEKYYAHLRPNGLQRIRKNRANMFTLRSQMLQHTLLPKSQTLSA